MHYFALIWIKTPEDAESQIAAAMEPYRETYNEDADEMTGFWDWWQIGGRYTGRLSDYDPTKDIRNYEQCTNCRGTGLRNGNPCNGCGVYNEDTGKREYPFGVGMALKWPTQWVESTGDIQPVGAIKDDQTCYTLIIGDRVLHKEEWNGKEWVPGALSETTVKRELPADGYVVAVDYHC